LQPQRRCERRERDGQSRDRRRHRGHPAPDPRLHNRQQRLALPEVQLRDPSCSGSGATGCTFGPSKGGACSTSSTTGNPATSNTSQDCPPEVGGGLFNGALAVDLNPLTTGSRSVTNISGTGSGNFCAGQVHAGAFGQGSTQCITETGMAAGDLTDGAPHAAREGGVFCIPATGNGTVNLGVDLAGPGATSRPGLAQIVPTP